MRNPKFNSIQTSIEGASNYCSNGNASDEVQHRFPQLIFPLDKTEDTFGYAISPALSNPSDGICYNVFTFKSIECNVGPGFPPQREWISENDYDIILKHTGTASIISTDTPKLEIQVEDRVNRILHHILGKHKLEEAMSLLDV